MVWTKSASTSILEIFTFPERNLESSNLGINTLRFASGNHTENVGKTFGDQVEILSGLNANDQYIISAEGKLFNGAKVSLK